MITFDNRYNYYGSSNVIDEDSKEQYPDILTVNWSLGKLTSIPSLHKVESIDMDKWWLFYYKKYETVNLDDVFMIINGIPYEGMLEPGSQLYLPTANDIKNWANTATQELDD